MISIVSMNEITDGHFCLQNHMYNDDMAAEDIVAESLVKYWRLSLSQEAETSETLLANHIKKQSLRLFTT